MEIQLAWKKLNEDVHTGYTGSGGDSTPPSVKQMLSVYKEMAYKKPKKGKKKK